MDRLRGFQRMSMGVDVDEQVRAEGTSTVGPAVNAAADSKNIPDTPVPRVGLVNLPNETILHILDFLNDESLFPLAFLSRCLHHLALPLYLSRKGFGQHPNDELVLFNYNARDVLKALHVSLFRPSLFRLYYPVDCKKSADELDKDIRILRDVVGNLTTLQEVVISFQNTTPAAPGETPEINPIVPPNPGGTPVPLNANYGVPDGFSGPFLISLFDAITSSGCKSFTIRHCGPQNQALEAVHAVVSHHFGGMRGLGRTFARFLKPWTSVKNRELVSFHLHSPMAFHSVLCRWTIETLNSAGIVSLSLAEQCYVAEHSWFLILPSIHIPTLTDLSIEFCSIHTSDLIKFLLRHTRLEKLVLGRNFELQRPAPPFPKRALTRLTHLTAPPRWINYLLGSLPALFSITILKWVPNKHSFKFSDLNRSLQPSILRLVAMQELRLSLSFGSASGVWMAPITTPSLDPLEPGSEDEGGGGGAQEEQTNPRTAHALISHMELCLKVHSVPFALTVRLPKWLAQFPNLKRLNLLTMSDAAAGLSSLERDAFVGAVLGSCPQLEGAIDFGRIKNPH